MADSRHWDQQVVDSYIFLGLASDIKGEDLTALNQHLDMGNKLAALTEDKKRLNDIVHGLLLAWLQTNGSDATYRNLMNALTLANRRDLANKVRDGNYSKQKDMRQVTTNQPDRRTVESPPPVVPDAPSDTPTPAETTSNVPCYPMSSKPRGKCLILSYDTFDDDVNKKKARFGNNVDEENLKEVFGNKFLKFDVDICRNLSFGQTEEKINDMSQKDHKYYDCFVLFVCSHGDEKTFLTSDNKEMTIQDVLTPFKAESCTSLAGKPKIFFFNTCRGGADQQFVQIQGDEAKPADEIGVGSTTSYFWPNEADFCVVLSTVPGYKSYRHIIKGTFFVQSLCKCLKNNYEKLDLIRILLLTNGDLIKVFQELKGCQCQLSTTTMTMS